MHSLCEYAYVNAVILGNAFLLPELCCPFQINPDKKFCYICFIFAVPACFFIDSAGIEEQKWQQRERQDELAVLQDVKNMRNVG